MYRRITIFHSRVSLREDRVWKFIGYTETANRGTINAKQRYYILNDFVLDRGKSSNVFSFMQFYRVMDDVPIEKKNDRNSIK